MSLFILSLLYNSFQFTGAAKKTWRSPIYSFFKPAVMIEVHNGCVAHIFAYSAKKCKAAQTVQHYQDTGDKSSTANLRHHAIWCFGKDIVNAAIKGEPGASQRGNIFSAFAHQGQQPITYSHCAHLNPEFHNHPANIASNPEFMDLLMTGHSHLKVPSPNTIQHDVKAAYVKCHECITKLLQDYPGRVHFTTDAWTSTNHHAFVAWTVHFKHNGTLAFLLDILKVPESQTGVALAKAFQKMLETFGVQDQVSL
ncbi:hypothetical protein L208DRAFT_1246708 [Tricholoma matsutake]|nr:hypothetical protein L208DRAFT_1246708 [Tricholoma matsutake 945]